VNMTRNEVVAELSENGYHPFLRPFLGSVVTAEAWTTRGRRQPLVIILYRKDTEEVVDLGNIPEDEEHRSEVMAFLDDFGERIFRPYKSAD
jgi:hypothetical protein